MKPPETNKPGIVPACTLASADDIRLLLKRFVLFGLVGLSGVFVDMGMLFLFSDPRMLGWGLSLSKTLAVEAAIVNNFVWNDCWTFADLSSKERGCRAKLRRFGKFNAICLFGMGLNVLLLNAQVRFFAINVYLANLIAICFVSLWNFWLNYKVGWSGQPRAAASE